MLAAARQPNVFSIAYGTTKVRAVIRNKSVSAACSAASLLNSMVTWQV